MEIILISILASLLLAGTAAFWINKSKIKNRLDDLILESTKLHKKNDELQEQVDVLTKKTSELLRSNRILHEEKNNIQNRIRELSKYGQIQDAEVAAQAIICQSQEGAEKIILSAKQQAEQIANDAYIAKNKVKELNHTVEALKNIIEGYGDAYIIPTYSLLDELADEVGYTEAGQELKAARSATRLMVKEGKAATCEYVEAKRKETAIRFVVDAFNGKVDSILSRGRVDNHGKLAQEIKDAYSLVNHNGSAFRNAKITDEYEPISKKTKQNN